jgi:hypothetical protein
MSVPVGSYSQGMREGMYYWNCGISYNRMRWSKWIIQAMLLPGEV